MASHLEGAPVRPAARTLKDVSPAEFIPEFVEYLKRNNFKAPSWAEYVKTGSSRELSPYDDDWFYVRAASIARQVYIHPGIGVGALSVKYGSAFRKRCRPQHLRKASRKVIRVCLKELEKLGLVETVVIGTNDEAEAVTKGRRLTKKGQKELDSMARNAYIKIAGAAAAGDIGEEDEV